MKEAIKNDIEELVKAIRDNTEENGCVNVQYIADELEAVNYWVNYSWFREWCRKTITKLNLN